MGRKPEKGARNAVPNETPTKKGVKGGRNAVPIETPTKKDVKGKGRTDTSTALGVDEDLEARALLVGALSAALDIMDTSQQLLLTSTVENLPDSLATQKQVNQSFRALAEEVIMSESLRFGKGQEAFVRHSEEHKNNIIETIGETTVGEGSVAGSKTSEAIPEVTEQSAQYDPTRPQSGMDLDLLESSDTGVGQRGIESRFKRKRNSAQSESLGIEEYSTEDDAEDEDQVWKRPRRQRRKSPESMFIDMEAKSSGQELKDDLFSERELSHPSFINDGDTD